LRFQTIVELYRSTPLAACQEAHQGSARIEKGKWPRSRAADGHGKANNDDVYQVCNRIFSRHSEIVLAAALELMGQKVTTREAEAEQADYGVLSAPTPPIATPETINLHRWRQAGATDNQAPAMVWDRMGSFGESRGWVGIGSVFSNLLIIQETMRVLIPPFVGSNPSTPAIYRGSSRL
jgi:hypothetical protein